MKSTASIGILAGLALGIVTSAARAVPIITNVVETGGDNEATDTIQPKWTGVTYNTTIANEPIVGPAGTPYLVTPFVSLAPTFVDRNHRYINADALVPIPAYLLGGEYIMEGNDNRDNANLQVNVTVNRDVIAYMLIDNRLTDTNNANPPTFDATHMQWILNEGWTAVSTGNNRTGNFALPDEVGIDEGADNTINNWYSVYSKIFGPGTFTLRQADNAGQNMYGVVIAPHEVVPEPCAFVLASFGLAGLAVRRRIARRRAA